MDQQRCAGKVITISVLVVLGIGYIRLFYDQGTLTGMNHVDGIIGVVLGLYICSHPASHLVDMLFYKRAIRYQFSSGGSIIFWLVVNLLAVLISGLVIFVGTTRLIGKTDWLGG